MVSVIRAVLLSSVFLNAATVRFSYLSLFWDLAFALYTLGPCAVVYFAHNAGMLLRLDWRMCKCKLLNVLFVNIVRILSSQKERRISMTKMYSISYLHYVLFALFLSTRYHIPCYCYDPIFPQGSLKFHHMLCDIVCFHGIESKRVL